jgi:hypothetical protein
MARKDFKNPPIKPQIKRRNINHCVNRLGAIEILLFMRQFKNETVVEDVIYKVVSNSLRNTKAGLKNFMLLKKSLNNQKI